MRYKLKVRLILNLFSKIYSLLIILQYILAIHCSSDNTFDIDGSWNFPYKYLCVWVHDESPASNESTIWDTCLIHCNLTQQYGTKVKRPWLSNDGNRLIYFYCNVVFPFLKEVMLLFDAKLPSICITWSSWHLKSA